jgi:hypothetical protein
MIGKPHELAVGNCRCIAARFMDLYRLCINLSEKIKINK